MQISKADLERFQAEVAPRYRFTRALGHGAFGAAFAAYDNATKKEVAIKRINNIFSSIHSAKQVLREIRLLTLINHPNIVNLLDIIIPGPYDKYKDIYLITDLMDTDLGQLIDSGQKLVLDHHRYFIYQVLRAVKFAHSANILHRDIKPSNIFVNSDCSIKLGDFGLARIVADKEDPSLLEENVATRWYKAPELILDVSIHGPGIDIWSIGCVLAELISGHPLFPGSSAANQIELISRVLGKPSLNDLKQCTNPAAKKFVQSLPMNLPQDIMSVVKGASAEEADLLKQMLTWDPNTRISADSALKHPYFARLHDPFDEPVTIPAVDFEFEQRPVTMETLRELIWREVRRYRPDHR